MKHWNQLYQLISTSRAFFLIGLSISTLGPIEAQSISIANDEEQFQYKISWLHHGVTVTQPGTYIPHQRRPITLASRCACRVDPPPRFEDRGVGTADNRANFFGRPVGADRPFNAAPKISSSDSTTTSHACTTPKPPSFPTTLALPLPSLFHHRGIWD